MYDKLAERVTRGLCSHTAAPFPLHQSLWTAEVQCPGRRAIYTL
jgi:hypothetical protein